MSTAPSTSPSFAAGIAGLLVSLHPRAVRIGHQVDRICNTLWFNWYCRPGGIQLAAGEADRCAQKISLEYSELLGRIVQLEQNPESAEIDRQVLRMLNISHVCLNSSRSYGDAIQLLGYRRGGIRSAMDWSVRTHRDVRTGKVVALVACRQAGGGLSRQWSRCVVGYGADDALAIVSAVLNRELVT